MACSPVLHGRGALEDKLHEVPRGDGGREVEVGAELQQTKISQIAVLCIALMQLLKHGLVLGEQMQHLGLHDHGANVELPANLLPRHVLGARLREPRAVASLLALALLLLLLGRDRALDPEALGAALAVGAPGDEHVGVPQVLKDHVLLQAALLDDVRGQAQLRERQEAREELRLCVVCEVQPQDLVQDAYESPPTHNRQDGRQVCHGHLGVSPAAPHNARGFVEQ
mmetsp:Transcript_10075/g.35171  ORF Transcript_10075/g.35171 Transcript_10075/m.35171 type:complete len:226 (+) Transcript_10075:2194-2871(+)